MKYFLVRKALSVIGIAVLLFGSASCIGPHKVNKWVQEHYYESPQNPPMIKDTSIVVTSAVADMGAALSTTEKTKGFFLPLLLYYGYEYRNECTVSPNPAINNLSRTLFTNIPADLRLRLRGNQLVLRIDQVPQVFTVYDKGHVMHCLITWWKFDHYTLTPQLRDLVVSYRLVSPTNEVLKKGTITVADKEEIGEISQWKSLGKLTKHHLDEYDANISAMAKKVLNQLNTEL